MRMRRIAAGISCALTAALVAALTPHAAGARPTGVAAVAAQADTTAPGGASTTTTSPGTSYDRITPAPDEPFLHVLLAAPSGTLRSTEEGSEWRFMFDRPVVELAAVGARPDIARTVTVTPAVAGTWRWASTRMLIFTPAKELASATRFTVVLKGMASVDGKPLKAPYTLTFTTPSVKCTVLGTDDSWRVGAANAQLHVTCDQPVDGADLAAHTTAAYRSLSLDPATYRPDAADLAKMQAADPAGTKALLDKLATFSKTKRSLGSQPVDFVRTDVCPEDARQTVKRTCHFLSVRGTPPTDATADIVFAEGITSKLGPVTSQARSDRLETPRTPLVRADRCVDTCDPESIQNFDLVTGVERAQFEGRFTIRDLTTKKATVYRVPPPTAGLTGEDAIPDRYRDPLSFGWADIVPGHTYEFEFDPAITDETGRALGYRSITTISIGNYSAYAWIRAGERVTEAVGKPSVRLHSRNVTRVERITERVEGEDLVRTVRQMAALPKAGTLKLTAFPKRTVTLLSKRNADRNVALPLPLDKGKAKPGVYVVAMRATGFEPDSRYGGGDDLGKWQTAVVQVTDLAVTVKQSPVNVLVSVTQLSTGKPVAKAKVALYDKAGKPYWTGKTGGDGFAWADPYPTRGCENCSITAVVERDDDVAYAQSQWRDGYDDTYWDEQFDSGNNKPDTRVKQGERLIGTVFTDRGVYKLGEQVRFKGLLRVEGSRDLTLPEKVDAVKVRVTDSSGDEVFAKSVPVGRTGAFDGSFSVPTDGMQGTYFVDVDDPATSGTSFLVASFRRPDFKVDVATGKDEYTMGDTVTATVDGRYLFGAAMDGRDVSWTARSYTTSYDPSEGHPALRLDGYAWQSSCWRDYEACYKDDDAELGKGDATLDVNGRLNVSVPMAARSTRHQPLRVQVEATVTDVNRQVIANRAEALVHPGDFYLGVQAPDSFGTAGQPIKAKVAALTPDGQWKPGVKVTAHLVRWEWAKATRKDGSESASTVGGWVSTEVASAPVTSASSAVPFELSPDRSGDYEVVLSATDSRGNRVETSTDVYVLGPGYVSWRTQENGSLTLVPEKTTYAPGDTARILVQSPWPKAEGIVTVERGEVFTAKRFTITSSAAALDVPVSEEHEPNVYVSVTVFKGRTAPPRADDPTDPGRPQVSFGTTELRVPPAGKKLTVKVTTDAKEYAPGAPAKATVKVTDADGKPAKGEITLWAVDEGVLRLTDYRQPELLTALYRERGDDVNTSDSRLRLVPLSGEEDEKGDEGPSYVEPGGGGGDEDTGEGIRTDFRIVAAWQATVETGKDGTATVDMKLPQSLTEYRVMAVGASGADRFGGGTTSLRIKKPFMVVPSLPRFLNLGDTTEAGVVLQNQTGKPGTATIGVKLPAGAPVSVVGSATRTLTLPPGPTEVRFPLKADKIGTLSVTFDGSFTGEGSTGAAQKDAVRTGFPVTVTRRLESVAAAGTVTAGAAGAAGTTAKEQLNLPAGIYPDLGGLELEVSTSALAGLQNGVKSLVEYPYGCLEQRSSRVRVLLMLRDLATTFPLTGLGSTAKIDAAIRTELRKLPDFQTAEGGLSYWPGDPRPDVYLSARVLVLLLDAEKLGLQSPGDIKRRLVDYLQSLIESSKEKGYWDDDDPEQGRPEIDDDGVWYNRADILYALARAGKAEPSLNDVLWKQRFSLTVFEQVHLLQAMLEAGETGSKPERLLRELLNGVRIEANQAFLQSTGAAGSGWCPCLSYLFAGRVHSTAALLSLLLKIDPKDELAPMMARWLLAQRDKTGAWQNTLESGYALTALVDYYKTQEAQAPDLQAAIALGSTSVLDQKFTGRDLSTTSVKKTTAQLVSGGVTAGQPVPLTVSATGTGKLFYTARLRYAPNLATLTPLDQGFTVQRDYLPYKGNQAATTFAAGDLVRVRLRITSAQQRQNVVIDDPLPAGFEGLDAQLSSTSLEELRGGDASGSDSGDSGSGDAAVSAWYAGVDHTELRDDRVLLFATTLQPGTFEYTYVARATAPGSFVVPPLQAEEMYRPEIFGRTGTVSVTVLPPGQKPAAAAPTTTAAPAAGAGATTTTAKR